MATILKIKDVDRGSSIEIYSFDMNNILDISMEYSGNMIRCSLDKQEVKDLIEYLHRRYEELD